MTTAEGDDGAKMQTIHRRVASPSPSSPADLEDQRLYASVSGRLFGRDDTIAIGRYRIEGRLGAGAMGEVYLGRDPDLDRAVAIKLVHAHLADERWAGRLRREAKALARLAHPNVVHVYEVGEHAGHVFLVMEYVRGSSLRAWIHEQRPAWPEVLAAYIAAGRGLCAAHGAGLTHRDFKPDNVLRGDDGRILVADFGLARLEGGVVGERAGDDHSTERAAPESPRTEAVLSRTGEVKGTPAYMPPEQLLGREVDARADQFAFCVALYEGLWGERPFSEATLRAQMIAMRDGPTPPRERGRVPEWVWPVLARGLAHEASARWPSMDALLAALEAAARRQRQRRAAAVLGLALGVTASSAALAGATLWPVQAPVEAACEEVARELEGVWGAASRQAIDEAFAATAVPWAADSSRRVGAAIDAWQARWVDARVRLCEASRAGGDSLLVAQQSACLEQRRGQLDALVGVLQAADAGTVHEATAAVGELDDPQGCLDDPSTLVLAPAPAAEQREAVSELDRRLDGVEAMIRAAQYAAARDALVPIEPAVAHTGHVPLEARLLELRGRALLWGDERQDQHDEGLAALERAADLAEGSRDDARLASAWRYLALWAFVEARDAKRGAPWLRRAEASARRLGTDPRRSGELAVLRGHQHAIAHDLDRAEQEFRTAVVDLEARGQTMRLLEARRALGTTLVLQGRLEEALEPLRTALVEAEQTIGSHHPTYGAIAYGLGAALLSLGRSGEAQPHLRAATSAWTESLRGDHPDLGIAHISLATIELLAERWAEAEAEIDSAEAVLRRTRPPEHPDHGDLASIRAALGFARGDFEQARRELDRVIELYRNAFGPSDPYLAKVTAERGWVWIALGDMDAAERDFETANAVLRGRDDLAVMRAASLQGLALVAGSRGDHERALEWLGQARPDGLGGDELASHHLWSAVLHWRLGHVEQAREHFVHGQAALPEAERSGTRSAMKLTDAELAALTGSR